MHESIVDVGGTKLRIVEAGEGDPLLFLHGAGGAVWTPLLEGLAKTWHVIAPEHPGFGKSTPPDWMTSIGDLAFFYLDVIEHLGLDRLHLVGHSLGGWTAAEIAIRNTARLKSLTLMAPAGVWEKETPYSDIFAFTPEEQARKMFVDPMLTEARLQQLATADLAAMQHNRNTAARLAQKPLLHNPQLPYWLHRIVVPTLIIWGVEDQIVPYGCHRQFMREIKGAELYALAQSGHGLHAERPQECIAKINAFAAKAP
jgi:pimeloyl-ACP methyl ester carboxylesterase